MRAPEVLLSDLIIGESPRWHDGRLWFCHWGADEIVALDAGGRAQVVDHDPHVRPHSIAWLPDGRRLVVPKSRDVPRLLVRGSDGALTPYGDTTGLPSGFNEIVVDGRANVYVNGAAFDFLPFIKRVGDSAVPLTQQPGYVPGFIALVTPDGRARQVAGDIEFPNGMVITPDNRTLIISESFGGRLTAFDIDDGGGLGNRRVWAEGLGPDGICLDADGAVWVSTGSTSCVRVREGGEILDRVELGGAPFALMLGGPDRRTLFALTADWNPAEPFSGKRTGRVLAVPAPAPGVGWP